MIVSPNEFKKFKEDKSNDNIKANQGSVVIEVNTTVNQIDSAKDLQQQSGEKEDMNILEYGKYVEEYFETSRNSTNVKIYDSLLCFVEGKGVLKSRSMVLTQAKNLGINQDFVRHEHNNVIGNSTLSNTNISHCAYFCMDTTEVAEEKDRKSKRCISILK